MEEDVVDLVASERGERVGEVVTYRSIIPLSLLEYECTVCLLDQLVRHRGLVQTEMLIICEVFTPDVCTASLRVLQRDEVVILLVFRAASNLDLETKLASRRKVEEVRALLLEAFQEGVTARVLDC